MLFLHFPLHDESLFPSEAPRADGNFPHAASIFPLSIDVDVATSRRAPYFPPTNWVADASVMRRCSFVVAGGKTVTISRPKFSGCHAQVAICAEIFWAPHQGGHTVACRFRSESGHLRTWSFKAKRFVVPMASSSCLVQLADSSLKLMGFVTADVFVWHPVLASRRSPTPSSSSLNRV